MRTLSLAVLVALSPAAFAAEGMWTLDNLPLDTMKANYDFAPDQAWRDRAMQGAARLAGGCSGSFVSDSGLVLTNHHCVIGCIQSLSSKENDYVNNGFLAAKQDEEKRCPGMEINRLEQISDVTARIGKATDGLAGKAYNDAKKAEQSKIEAECAGQDAGVRCDIVELYQGGVQHLYRYARFQDVRLAFSPEYASGFFGGDPDNFNFPRYNLDMALLRVYQDGNPLKPKHYFPINPAGAEEGELVMSLGHPGTTQRLLTVAQLETQRDLALPSYLTMGHELRGILLQFSAENAENARIAQTELTMAENGLKARGGMVQALRNAKVMDAKRADEKALRDWVLADPERAQQYGDPWTDIAQAQTTARDLHLEYGMIEGLGGFRSRHVGWARSLLRAAEERGKPDGERLREYAEAGLPAVRARLLADSPTYPHYEKVKLAWSLSKLREHLGADHPVVREVIGKKSPQSLADELVDGSKLADPKLREALWEGGAEAVAKNDDPAIALARLIDAHARALRTRHETEVQAVERRSAEKLAQARFARHGSSVYPDATFSLRLSHGVVRGWEEKGQTIAPFTTIAGIYERASDFDPYRLAPRWVTQRDKLDLDTRFNLSTTNDVVGGNSGSPIINAKGEVVGLVFDGNIHSLGGSYSYDEALNRTVSVHPAAMVEALDKVYDAQALLKELGVR